MEPILRAAECTIDLRTTGPAKSAENAATLAASINLADYDVIVPVSGDGVVHEILNGLASREDALEALKMPLAPIPAGSGNALCVNLLGNKKVNDYAYAALGCIKGRPMALDLCSFTQGEKRIFSFLSVASGLVADLDLGTEHLRSVLSFQLHSNEADLISQSTGKYSIHPRIPLRLHLPYPLPDGDLSTSRGIRQASSRRHFQLV